MPRRRRDKGARAGASPGRILLGLAASALLAFGGWCLLRVDTQYGPALGPDRILADAGNLRPTMMEARAHAALRDRPVDGTAFRMLGIAAARRGASERAQELYRIAVRRDPRDWQAHAFLMDEAFRRGAAGEGIEHLDAILRVEPGLGEALLQALAPDLDDVSLRTALVDSLAADPPWTGRMMSILMAPSTDPAIAAEVIEDLSTRRPLAPLERSALIDTLARSDHPAAARATWLHGIDARERALADNVFDGDFEETEPVIGEFAWSWDGGPGVELSLEQGHAASGQQSLRIDFSGRAVKLRAPSQRLALAPGPYNLSAAFNDGTNASRPFILLVTCTPGAELARVELSGGAQGEWARIDHSFEVPLDCKQQRLSLIFRSRSVADTQIAGVLRLDDIAIRNSLRQSSGAVNHSSG